MIRLANKKVILCVTGGIAAYKTAELTRLFKKNNADVRIIMSKSSKEFVTPLTLQALSGNKIHHSLLDEEAESGMGHIELAKWADILIIAPCTAESIAKFAHGRANDLMSAVLLATDAKVFIAPAMNTVMWEDNITKKNVDTLKLKGFNFIGPDSGEQACGDLGYGRMTEPDHICNIIANSFKKSSFNNKNILITAGPTNEPIDPVRYLTNRSSGKMGYSLASSAYDSGANVTLISGPVDIKIDKNINLIKVNTAEDMLEAVIENIKNIDVFIGCAAVADFKPLTFNNSKIKKVNDHEEFSIKLIKNPDILKYVSEDTHNALVIGFCAETEDVIENAKTKLINKSLDMIVCNDVSDKSIGFDADYNEVHVITKNNLIKINKTTKSKIAFKIINEIATLMKT